MKRWFLSPSAKERQPTIPTQSMVQTVQTYIHLTYFIYYANLSSHFIKAFIEVIVTTVENVGTSIP